MAGDLQDNSRVSAIPPWGCLTLGRPTPHGQPCRSPDGGDTGLGDRSGAPFRHSCRGAPAASPPRPLCSHSFACDAGTTLTSTGCPGKHGNRGGARAGHGAGRPPLRAGHRSSFCNVAQWHPERFRGFQTGAQQRPAPLHETQRGVITGDSCLIRDEAPAFRRIPAPHPTLPPDAPAEEGPDCVASRALPAGPPRQSPRAKAGGGPTRHRVPPPAQRWDPPRVSRGWSRLLREHPAVRPIPGSRSRVRTHCGPLPHARAAPPGTFSALALHDLNTRVYPDFSQRRGSCLRSIAILPGPDPRGPGAWSPRARAPRHLLSTGPWASSVTALRPAPPAAKRGSSSSLSRCPEVQAPRDYVSEREVPTTLPPPASALGG